MPWRNFLLYWNYFRRSSLWRSVSYRDTSFRFTYMRSFRRFATIRRIPRREWLSFLWTKRWFLSDSILSVRTAICTSGEPVSPLCWAYSSIRAFFSFLSMRKYFLENKQTGKYTSRGRVYSKRRRSKFECFLFPIFFLQKSFRFFYRLQL